MDDGPGTGSGLNLAQAWGVPSVIVFLTLVGLGLGWLAGTALHARAALVLLGTLAGAGAAELILYKTVSAGEE